MTMTEPQKRTSGTAEPQVPGLKVGARTEFCVIGDVIPGQLDALRQVLKGHMADPRTQEAVNEIGAQLQEHGTAATASL